MARRAPGTSSSAALDALEKLAREKLPAGVAFEWTDLSYQEILARGSSTLIFPLCVLLAFLVLAAQYESWTLPLAVILIVPMCIVSAMAGVWLTGGDNNIFTKIGLPRPGRAGVQERHPHRGVRRASGAAGPQCLRCGGGSLPAAPASHHHDLAGLHHGRGAADVLLGCGLRRCASAMGVAVFSGMLGVTLLRAVPHAGVLRADPRVREAPAGRCRMSA